MTQSNFEHAVNSLRAPDGPRALLVSLSSDGQIQHKPVARGASVLDIGAELMAHLTDYPCSDAFLAQLQQYCESRLEARRQARGSGGFVFPQPGNVWTIMHTTPKLSMDAVGR